MMPSRPTPLLGYNTSVRHEGVTYHLQTEDSGVAHPHVITQVFHEGRVLAKRKTSYASFLESPTCLDLVRELIRAQHTAMFAALREGRFPLGNKSPTEEPPFDVAELARGLPGRTAGTAPREPAAELPAPASGAEPPIRSGGSDTPVPPRALRRVRAGPAALLFSAALGTGESIDDVIIDHLSLYLQEPDPSDG